ncbi:MAG: hypothetical protein ACRD4O_16000 [Bryobacteraceae bacterium]
MAAQLTLSLFPGRTRVEGSEIKFRAVCALGWAIYENFVELRSIAEDLPDGLDVLHWIDYIEAGAIDQFTARDAANWPRSVSDALLYLRTKAEVKGFPKLVAFFEQLAKSVTLPKALDPGAQLSDLNLRGFTLASRLIDDPYWSTHCVGQKWNRPGAHKWSFCEDTAGNLQPVTSMQKDEIQLRVNTQDFAVKNALLFYLTLEFQMMHEYISHLLPVWNSGNALKEEFLLATMFLYYRECGPRNGLVSLVREADERRGDSHRKVRQFIMDELAPAQERRLSQLLLELAVLDDREMIPAEKRHLLALLKKVPLQEDVQLRTSMQSWIAKDDPPTLYGRLRAAIAAKGTTPLGSAIKQGQA